MKLCKKCNIQKNINEFHKDKNSKDGHNKICKICLRELMKQSYYKDPKKAFIRSSSLKKKIQLIVNKIKEDSCCKFCAEKTPECLDFHHIDPNNKDKGVSYWVSAKSLEKTMDEINKCIIVCANCHRKIHSGLIII